jgi:hypothetical protein
MAELTLGFYKDLYQSEGTEDMDSLIGTVPRKVSEEMNAMLEAPLSREEVRVALFQMFPTKAPGPKEGSSHPLLTPMSTAYTSNMKHLQHTTENR